MLKKIVLAGVLVSILSVPVLAGEIRVGNTVIYDCPDGTEVTISQFVDLSDQSALNRPDSYEMGVYLPAKEGETSWQVCTKREG